MHAAEVLFPLKKKRTFLLCAALSKRPRKPLESTGAWAAQYFVATDGRAGLRSGRVRGGGRGSGGV